LSKGNAVDLGLKTAFDELFMSDAGRAENRLPKIYDIPLTEIDDFPEHPFKVMLDEDMDQLVQSIKERGIITPITLRQKEDGRYEIVSGHRRKKACELAGLETVKSEIKELTRDEAIILMVESNYQRSSILPSEKAFAYKMRLEAMKRQAGRPSKENCDPVGHNLAGIRSVDVMAEDSPDSRNQIQRYVRLTELSPDLLNMVDENQNRVSPRGGAVLPQRGRAEITVGSHDLCGCHTFTRPGNQDEGVFQERQAHTGGHRIHHGRRKAQSKGEVHL
jgi:ParB family chromosome partitioning protein